MRTAGTRCAAAAPPVAARRPDVCSRLHSRNPIPPGPGKFQKLVLGFDGFLGNHVQGFGAAVRSIPAHAHWPRAASSEAPPLARGSPHRAERVAARFLAPTTRRWGARRAPSDTCNVHSSKNGLHRPPLSASGRRTCGIGMYRVFTTPNPDEIALLRHNPPRDYLFLNHETCKKNIRSLCMDSLITPLLSGC